MNMKFGIGVVIAIVLQVSAFVWWTAQQAQTPLIKFHNLYEITGVY